MATRTTCSKCQSTKIIPEVYIRDYSPHVGNTQLSVEIYEDPNALIFKGRHEGALNARVCGDCGYTELYVENPQELYSIYLNREPSQLP
jgi:predicted nucleic-acid-binding Zn-ribbon protein